MPVSREKISDKPVKLSFLFTPKTFIVDHPDAPVAEDEEALREEFLADRYKALFHMGFSEIKKRESSSLIFLHRLSAEFVEALTGTPDLEVAREETQVELTDAAARRILGSIPFGIGTEYITKTWVRNLFREMNRVFAEEMGAYEGTAAMFLAEHSQELRVPERIFFHLVENKGDAEYPFAFLATYATKGENGGVRHMPLSYALTEYHDDRQKLLELLSCLNRASGVSPLIAQFVESGEMFHPLRLTPEEAFQFLKAVEDIEACGIVCRVPNWWRRKSSAVSLQVSLGAKKPSLLGFESIVSAVPKLAVDGVPLTKAEIKTLLASTEGLAYLKGRWVEVNHDRLRELLARMDKYGKDLTLLEALRMENGLEEGEAVDDDVQITNGKWLSGFLSRLRKPASIRQAKVPSGVHASLRPYQRTGYTWLKYMSELGFGACLADDMGLGKTLQVLTFLEMMREKKPESRVLLVVPASLLGNWSKEAARFTPDITISVLHGKKREVLEEKAAQCADFLTITTYTMAARIEALRERTWDCLILDEAQAIKNPGTKQTRALKKLQASFRIALTGTPVENDLTNLWSLFDFLDKGLLGSQKEFSKFASGLDTQEDGYQKLRGMVSPFILRRLKSDKSIISDLPDKIEETDYVDLSREQVVLYRRQVADLEKKVEDAEGMQRRGLVLATITKLKQICNHPDQYLGQSEFDPAKSGKFRRLGEICDTIYQRRERALIFTQYKEIIPYLERYLRTVFGSDGLVIHGGIPVKKRQELVDRFNGESYVPFMVLSVKAAGTGLNLTAANHVIHFDRWWNPAVENQATDRAYRIGQDKNVVVHKFVATGTIEEKIDELINSKKELAENVVGSGENWITELDNSQLLDLMRLE